MPTSRQVRLGFKSPNGTRGFSLLELVVVIAITTILTAIMFPGIAAARNSCYKLMCASNLRQLGMGINMFSSDHNDQIPNSTLSQQSRPLDQMALTCLDPAEDALPDRYVLDGLGQLLSAGNSGCYCDASQCLYCPSHTNTHTYDRYARSLQLSSLMAPTFDEQVWSNYHYVGQRSQLEEPASRVFLESDEVIVTDGFRTQADYNHRIGMNKLYGDGSVEWWQDVQTGFLNALPTAPEDSPEAQRAVFLEAWGHFEAHDQNR